jgi:hypothetical protein
MKHIDEMLSTFLERPMSRTCFLAFGPYGDVSIRWDQQNDGQVLPAIQSMLDRGFKFFIMKKKLIGGERTEVTTVDQVAKNRSIVIPDATLEQLHLSGLITAGSVIVEGDVDNTGELAKTVEAVAAADTVVTPPASGG